MNFSRDEVYDVCKVVALKYDFDPKLIFAVCLQEGAQNKKKEFAPDIARLEQGYYRKYVEPMTLATTSEILLSASYGIMQMMGLSLKEAGYFEWYFYSQCDEKMRKLLGSPLSQFAIPNAIDTYCVNLFWMIDWGAQWLAKKREIARGNEKKMLCLWNGDLTGKYYNEVMKKIKTIK